MKRWMKGMLAAAVVCMAAGTAVCGVAWAMGGRFSHYRHKRYGITAEDRREPESEREEVLQKENRISPDDPGRRVYAESEPFQETEKTYGGWLMIEGNPIKELEITVGGLYAEVIFDEGAEEITVDLSNDDYRYDQEVDDDTLKINVRKRKDTFDALSDFDQSGDIGAVIRIPAGCVFQDVELEVNGGMLLVGGITADTLDLELKAGGLEVVNSNVGELNGDCKAGELFYEGTVQRQIEADCSAGTIEYALTGSETDFNYELEKEMGSIVINGTERGQFDKKEVVNHPGAGKKAELECKVGAVSINFSEP